MSAMPMTCEQVRDLLPAYVLGALERSDEAAVREHLDGCALHAEAAQLGSVVPYLAETSEPVEPPVALRARILAAAAADLETRRTATPAAAAAERPGPVAPVASDRTSSGLPRFRLSWGWALQAAAVVAIVALGVWNLGLQSRIGGLEDDVVAARAYERALVDVLASAAQPGSQTAILGAPEGDGPWGLAAVTADGSVVLAMHGLDPTVGAQVYEAWVIVGDAAPVPIGGFAVDATRTGTFTSTTTPAGAGAIVALTLEAGPGATTPTLPIIALGKATAPPA